jgi:hypothetical protein
MFKVEDSASKGHLPISEAPWVASRRPEDPLRFIPNIHQNGNNSVYEQK